MACTDISRISRAVNFNFNDNMPEFRVDFLIVARNHYIIIM